MFEFFGCVAAALAVAAPVVNNLADILVGGRKIYDFAADILGRFGKKVPPAQQQVVIRATLTQAAAMPALEFEKQMRQVVDAALPGQPTEVRQAITGYITLMPARIRQTFARLDDPTGKTVPPGFTVQRPEDLIPLLPPRLPLFKEGDSPPEAPRWILVERLAIGGFGEVWKARGKSLENTFSAFKFCLDPQLQPSFVNEVKNIELVKNELVDNPHIVKPTDAYLDGPTPWIQYEFIPGGDLGQLVSTWPADINLRAPMAVEKIGILADTLDHCHNRIVQEGIRKVVIHRDMKPANVLIGRNGTLKITDFGISQTQARQALDEARIATVSGMTASTPEGILWANTPMYASEQQKEGQKPHPADDVHALGVMLYQMILGNINRPLNKDYIAVLERQHVCRQLIALISQSIASDREYRFQHAGELAEALKRLPKKLIAKPEPEPGPGEETKRLTAKVDAWYAEADAKNAEAAKHLDRRDWAGAVKVLESIPHRRMIDQDLYSRAVAHRDGKRFINGLGMEFALVPKGTFWMGGSNGACGGQQVAIDRDFYIGVYPVTQEEWQKVMGNNPSWFQKGGRGAEKLSGVPDADLKRFPVECVSWNDCQVFIQKLNEKLKEGGWMYRLPREAEWEYACRGGATSQAACSWSFYFRSPTNTLSAQQANFSDSALARTSRVGSYEPNALGLFDMHGNVWEWCEDALDGSRRVFRGGGWTGAAESCGAACRFGDAPADAYYSLGLRLARVPVR